MRIQHNIAAMSSYRNYTNNVSAVNKNLEKLSSGYKINRAGDDAAGLAISEKMRAQISGLEAAQKNAKDGISLVQTAEGALTEVHDMLNRMVTLATQSANGTYDNETDREQLQKELDQLKAEIDRIADSSNFNGIKLLDGSMSTDANVISGDARIISDVYTSGNAAELSGTKTFLDGEVATDAVQTVFDVDFTGLTAKDTGAAAEGTKAVYEVAAPTNPATTTAAANEIEIGGQKITVAADDDIDDLVTALKANTTLTAAWDIAKDGNNITFTAVAGKEGEVGTSGPSTTLAGGLTVVKEGTEEVAATGTKTVAAAGANSATIGGATVDLTNTQSGTITGATWSAETNADGDYVITYTSTATDPTADVTVDGTNLTGGAAATAAKYQLADVADAIKTATSATKELDVGGKKYAVTSDDIAGQLKEWVAAYNKDTANSDYTASLSGDGSKVVLTAKKGGAVGTSGPAAAPGLTGETEATAGAEAPAGTVDFTFKIGNTSFSGAVAQPDDDAEAIAAAVETALDAAKNDDDTVTINGNKYTYEASGSKVTFTLADTPTEKNVAANFDWDVIGNNGDSFDGNHTAGVIVTTTGSVYKDAPLANTVFKLESSDIKDGTQITIDGTTVTLAVGKNSQHTKDANVIDLTWMEESAVDLNQAISAISDGFKAGTTNFIVGVNDTSNGDTHAGLTVHKKADSEEQYTTKAELAGVFSLTKPAAGGLTLQIGDTADTYNQLNVSINDCHSASLGISGVDISTQEGAASAIDAIKSAINYVSDVRGTLGATQNRLEHTINNLSVMTENIQDAESTIRDTDIAEEMMAYTKNNILVQSAQAMLAQANQIPQGVLQLLG